MSGRAVLWLAVSSDAQAAADKISLPDQERQCRAWCAAQDFAVLRVLSVPGYSRHESDVVAALDDFAAQGIYAYHELRALWAKPGSFDVLVCYHDSRLGRSSSLYTYVVENTIRAGARIYRIDGGWINPADMRIQIALGNIAATEGVDRLVRARRTAMDARARRGLPTSSGVVMSHRLLRDGQGRALRLVVDEAGRLLWEDVATLLLEGVGWRQMERALFERFGHAGPGGVPWAMNRMYAVLTNPAFWGHSARYHRPSNRSWAPVGPWVLEPGHAVPEGVLIHYDTHEPVYTGEQGARVRAEMRRRFAIIAGGTRPAATYWATGLFVCGACGYQMARYGAAYLKCMSHWAQSPTRPDCDQRRALRLDVARAAVDALLRQALAAPDAAWGVPDDPPATDRATALRDALATIEGQIARLIARQAAADDVADLYQAQIDALAAQRTQVRARLVAAEADAAAVAVEGAARDQALDELRAAPDLWTLPETTLNQLLHRLMGRRRFLALDGEVVGVGDAR